MKGATTADYEFDHRRSQGMDFIDIRKEITSELRTIDAKLKSNAFKVHKRDLGKT
jgi:hypothetical protein